MLLLVLSCILRQKQSLLKHETTISRIKKSQNFLQSNHNFYFEGTFHGTLPIIARNQQTVYMLVVCPLMSIQQYFEAKKDFFKKGIYQNAPLNIEHENGVII